MNTFSSIAIDNNDIDRIDKYRRKFNTSVLTILFTDIESSTKLRENLGDKGYTELLEKHDAILLPVVSDTNGLHIKSIGDSILAVFSQPSDAVECAIQIQDAIHNSPLIKPFLKIRIGIDMGQVAKEQSGGILKDIFGRFVNRAARIEGLANGGHIMCSESVQDNAVGWVDSAKIRWHDHGFHNVKGVEKPLRIWEPFNANVTDHDTIPESSRNEDFIGKDSENLKSKDKKKNIQIIYAPKEKPPFEIEALVIEQDTFLVSNAEAAVKKDGKTVKQLISEAKVTLPLSVGSVLVRGQSPVKFIAITYDYDENIICKEEFVKISINKIVNESEKRKFKSIGLPPLGSLHENISFNRFIVLLNSVLSQISLKHLKNIWIITRKLNKNGV